MVDFAVALAPSLIWGTMSLLLVGLGGDSRQRTMGEVTGALLVSLVLAPFLGVHWDARTVVISLVTGMILGIGIQFQVQAMGHIGVSRTMPISTGGQLIGIGLSGVIFLHEWRAPGALPIGLTALVVLSVGVAVTTWTEGASTPVEGHPPDWTRGRVDLLISTIGLVVYLPIQQALGISGVQAMVPQFLGCVLVCLVGTSPRFSPEFGPRDTRWSMTTVRQLLPGAMWGVGVILMQTSAGRVGVAMGFSLSQLGVVISTLGGIVVLGERRTRRELVAVGVGICLIVIGAILIGVAKSLDA